MSQVISFKISRLGLERGVSAGARECVLWNDFPFLGQPTYARAAFLKQYFDSGFQNPEDFCLEEGLAD